MTDHTSSDWMLVEKDQSKHGSYCGAQGSHSARTIEAFRVREGEQLPEGTRFLQFVASEDVSIGAGTATVRVYVVLVEDLAPSEKREPS